MHIHNGRDQAMHPTLHQDRTLIYALARCTPPISPLLLINNIRGAHPCVLHVQGSDLFGDLAHGGLFVGILRTSVQMMTLPPRRRWKRSRRMICPKLTLCQRRKNRRPNGGIKDQWCVCPEKGLLCQTKLWITVLFQLRPTAGCGLDLQMRTNRHLTAYLPGFEDVCGRPEREASEDQCR